jgi:hypothetical protein
VFQPVPPSRSRFRQAPLAAAIAGTLCLLGGLLQLNAANPVKLELTGPPGHRVIAHKPSRGTVRLLDAHGNPVPAAKDLPVQILLRRRAAEEPRLLTQWKLPKGQSEVSGAFTVPEAGLIYLWARHPELLPGGANLRSSAPVSDPAPGVRPRPSIGPGGGVNSRGPISIRSQTPYKLALRYAPQRPFLANGEDSATVQAFVSAPEGLQTPEIRLNFFDSSGTLHPKPLVIPAGEDYGEAVVSSRTPGPVRVELVNSRPQVEIDGYRQIELDFGPPIVGMAVEASPSRLTLLDRCDVVVRLIDSEGIPLATANPRKVTLTVREGRGVLDGPELVIGEREFEQRVSFVPTWWGKVRLDAATPNMITVPVEFHVGFPFALLAISIGGGLLGGFVYRLRHRRAKLWRVGVGGVTGFILYWACLFGFLAAGSTEALLNPLSVFAISLLGGWAGTEVLDHALQSFGMARKPA